MPIFKVTYNGKPKKTQEVDCDKFDDLGEIIQKKFGILAKTIKYIKPRIKDQTTFDKQIKEGIQITILGTIASKQKTEEELKKQQQMLEKAKKQAELTKISPQQHVLKKLKEKNIKQRGMQYVNQDTGQIQDLGADYICAPVHLLRNIKQFREYCNTYQVQSKNPDGLIIQQLKFIMDQTDGNLRKRQIKQQEMNESAVMIQVQAKSQNKQIKQQNKQIVMLETGIVDPIQWISSWITYCSDDIQFPYPTYDFDYFFNRLFGTMKNAYDITMERRDEQSNQPQQQVSTSKVDPITAIVGVQVNTKRTDITKLDEDDDEGDKQTDRKVFKYFLQCDLSKDLKQTKQTKNSGLVIQGIKERFKKKRLWRNFYAFDIEYEETILDIDKLPKNLLIHCNRIGYPPAVQEWEYINLLDKQKNMQKIRFGTVLDLYPLCNPQLRDKLQQGRYQKQQLFYPYHTDERYVQFLNKNQNNEKFKVLSENEKRYMFFDSLLYQMNIYDQYYKTNLSGSKQTGQFRLSGMILHKGKYYHNRSQTHKHNCIGQFMTIVHKTGRKWLKFKRSEVDQCDIEDVTSTEFWGGKDKNINQTWTPVVLMYSQIKIKNMQLQPSKRSKKQAL